MRAGAGATAGQGPPNRRSRPDEGSLSQHSLNKDDRIPLPLMPRRRKPSTSPIFVSQGRVNGFWRLAPRAEFELLVELGERHPLRTAIEQAVAPYVVTLDRETLVAVGGNRFAPLPLHIISFAR
jgi:hypothetical protein